MKQLVHILLAASALSLSSCDAWVDGAMTPKDTLTPEQIRRPKIVATVAKGSITDGPLIAYVRTLHGEAAAGQILALGAMTDELTEGRVPNALLYRHLSSDIIQSNSGTADGLWSKLQDYYARSSELLEVVRALGSATTEDAQALQAYANFTGHLHSGLALQMLAETFSTTPNRSGGSVRISGRMHPHADLLNRALEHYQEAYSAAQIPLLAKYQGSIAAPMAMRQAKSLALRLEMYRGNYVAAAKLLPEALKQGERIEVIYNTNGGNNPLFSAVGSDARDVQISPELEVSRSNEAERKALPLAHRVLDKAKPSVYNIYASALHRHSPLVLMDEADIRLIRSELIVRGLVSGDALSEVNALISSYDPASQEAAPLSIERLAHLRRIYLALRGARAADMRRELSRGTELDRWQQRRVQWIPLPERELLAPLR